MVGLTGYPNVGKSSTINALFGSKKTAVAPTPGKTKHFQVCPLLQLRMCPSVDESDFLVCGLQTLNVMATLCLCDCPGLVLPQYAHSKAEMVAAGGPKPCWCGLHPVSVIQCCIAPAMLAVV